MARRAKPKKKPVKRPARSAAKVFDAVLTEVRASLGHTGAAEPIDAGMLRSIALHCHIDAPPDLVRAWAAVAEPPKPHDIGSFTPESMIGATDYLAMKAGHDRF